MSRDEPPIQISLYGLGYQLPELLNALRGLLPALEEISTGLEPLRYFDTPTWSLYRSGLTCLLRGEGPKAVLALQPLIASPGWKWPMPPRELVAATVNAVRPLALTGSLILDWLGSVLPQQPLIPILEWMEEEALVDLPQETNSPLRLALHSYRPIPGSEAPTFAAVELCGASGGEDSVATLATAVLVRLGWEQSTESLFQVGVGLANLDLPSGKWEGYQLSPVMPQVDAAYAVLRQQYRQFDWNEPGTLLGLEPESLHAMRVATRRMRATMRLFQDVLPERRVVFFSRELRWIGRALGKVRDLDVYSGQLALSLERIPQDLRGSLQPYLAQLQQECRQARQSLAAILQSKRYQVFRRSFGKFLERGPLASSRQGKAVVPVGRAAAEMLTDLLSRTIKEGRAIRPASPSEQLHAQRIRCKRLRYACECFQELYGLPCRRFIRRLREIQDILGSHQDRIVAEAKVRSFVEHAAGALGNRKLMYFGLGQLAAMEREGANAGRQAFAKIWKEFDRKKVRLPLERELQRVSQSMS